MSVYESSITNPKKQLEFYKDLSEQLQQENKQLKEKIKTYEDPEDMTLMYMWCNEKAKDKIKQLKEVIEEVREYIKDACYYYDLENYSSMTSSEVKELLQILDKVKDVK